jgi:hypothetical protein
MSETLDLEKQIQILWNMCQKQQKTIENIKKGQYSNDVGVYMKDSDIINKTYLDRQREYKSNRIKYRDEVSLSMDSKINLKKKTNSLLHNIKSMSTNKEHMKE